MVLVFTNRDPNPVTSLIYQVQNFQKTQKMTTIDPDFSKNLKIFENLPKFRQKFRLGVVSARLRKQRHNLHSANERKNLVALAGFWGATY